MSEEHLNDQQSEAVAQLSSQGNGQSSSRVTVAPSQPPQSWGTPPGAATVHDPGTGTAPIDADFFRYAIRAMVRCERCWGLLAVGCRNDRHPLPAALLACGEPAQALMWDGVFECWRQHQMLHDCERLLLITHGLSGDTAYNAVDFDEVRHLLQGCFENEPPDVGAGQDAIVDLLRFHLVDRVRGAAWHAWFDNGGSPPELIEQRVAVIEQQLNDFVQHGGEPEGPLTDAELEVLIENDEELVQGVLVARQPAILGGPQKTLKTLLGLDMALSLATGSCWLGNPDWRTMQPRRVAFYSGESGGRVLHRKRRIMEQVKRLGLEPDEQRQFDDALQQDNFRWEVRRSHLPDFSDRNSLDRWRRQIERVQSEVVFLDPTLLCLGAAGKDVANASISGQAVMAAVDACQSVGATLVLLHHSAGDRVRRQSGQGQEPLELWDLAYPGITQFMRQWIA